MNHGLTTFENRGIDFPRSLNVQDRSLDGILCRSRPTDEQAEPIPLPDRLTRECAPDEAGRAGDSDQGFRRFGYRNLARSVSVTKVSVR
jgi:hypothetical protein